MFAVYYDNKRLTKPGTEYEARMDLLRLQAMFLNLEVRECRKSAAGLWPLTKGAKTGKSR
ncbi:hypothetical protein [Paenibacillus sp. GYB003]|jgi:hypothetical protein|uniref:hypothetical protein n=1 Tax=Paenibacillus sp. GYB003 TaxID=2994392 RepID=UPI002F96BC06